MKLATSSMIKEIDAFCEKSLGIPTRTLMKKAGEAIADAVRKSVPAGSRIVILAGKGNNGGDGYAAATVLLSDYKIRIYDIFSAGQKTEEGKHFLSEYLSLGGEVVGYDGKPDTLADIRSADCIIDAIFGTGFSGNTPESLRALAITVREAVGAHKIAVDVPLGINPDNGSVNEFATAVSATVALSFIKPGIISYPARSSVGEIIYSGLGIPENECERAFEFRYNMLDARWACESMPKREANSNKGTFGKLLLITGSDKYRGAAHLSVEAALRSGVGLVSFVGCESLVRELSAKYPEVIYKDRAIDSSLTDEDIRELVALSSRHSATLVGSGSDTTDGLLRLTLALLASEGGALILDADAINVLAELGEEGIAAIRRSQRTVILTPHPLEYARLSMNDVSTVQQHRLEVAERFAAENRVVLVLKGAGTVITDGVSVHINISGSSALAKAGSGDVLAGALSGLVATGGTDALTSSALAVFIHAVAGERLASEFSTYGVTPSDLPKEMARVMKRIEDGTLGE
ncbi:MAG: NAD(P)H-hydrate dehydratase [Clostridia bacterium]|nr:NAD(P)H-hydrate dehydratase [Clostridia bacterium]